jgi:2-polyprenyl-6-methoxyphenol hydroxylase-like FAD-dependent oxidoreductase
MPRRQRTAAIIGGSLTGLIAARLLAQRGWAAHVFERVPEVLSGRGAGIGTHPEFFDVLRAAHLPDGPDIGVYVTIRRMLAKGFWCKYWRSRQLGTWKSPSITQRAPHSKSRERFCV